MIKIDIPMPKCCDECFALDDDGDYPFCLITRDQRGYNFNTREKRMPTCPLIKVQERQRRRSRKNETVEDWSGAQGNDIERIIEQARRSEQGVW